MRMPFILCLVPCAFTVHAVHAGRLLWVEEVYRLPFHAAVTESVGPPVDWFALRIRFFQAHENTHRRHNLMRGSFYFFLLLPGSLTLLEKHSALFCCNLEHHSDSDRWIMGMEVVWWQYYWCFKFNIIEFISQLVMLRPFFNGWRILNYLQITSNCHHSAHSPYHKYMFLWLKLFNSARELVNKKWNRIVRFGSSNSFVD